MTLLTKESWSKDWCKGFCRTCGTGCGEFSEAVHTLREENARLQKQVSGATSLWTEQCQENAKLEETYRNHRERSAGVIEHYKAENAKLREALVRHKHTDKCWKYAARTNRNCGQYFCIAECLNAHGAALSGEEFPRE